MVLTAVPGTLILRLFLTPDHLGQLGEWCQRGGQFAVREGVELLDAYQGYVSQFVLAPRFEQVVINLARTEDDSGNGFRLMIILFTDDILETPLDAPSGGAAYGTPGPA